jgi:GxxExxY protein
MLVVALSFGGCIPLELFYRSIYMHDNKNILYKELSHTIIGIAMRVHTKLGAGLPEMCYLRSMSIELVKADIPHSTNHRVEVEYDDKMVGHLIPDLVVDSKIVLEFKSVEGIYPHHISQLFSYLNACKIRVGYVVNFGMRSLQFKRLII